MPRGIRKKYGIGAMPNPILSVTDGEGGGSGAPPAAPADPGSGGDDGKGGKQAILADLATERDKRQALEATVQQMQTAQAQQMDQLAKAFGLKPEELSDADKVAGQISDLTTKVGELTKQNLVLTVVSEHNLSTEDAAVIAALPDEATMRTVAARLQEAAKAQPNGKPKADPPSNGGGAPQVPVDKPGLPRLRAAYETAETP